MNPQDYKVYITVVVEVVGAPKNWRAEPEPAMIPPVEPPPVEVFTSNVLDLSVAETITEAGTLSTVGTK